MVVTPLHDPEIASLLEAIYSKYGYDFRQYSGAHIQRRVTNRMILSGLKSVHEVKYKLLNDSTFAAQLLSDLSITVTEMFRDPQFYQSLRQHVIPLLKTYSFIKIWHAGCATGEEVYSMAILLKEEGLYDRSTIYATDFNQRALNQAKEGIFANSLLKEYTLNYQRAGGTEPFSGYYTSSHDTAIINQALKKNIVWANHNLVTDSVFTEAHLIMCRNVLIYFNRDLQNHVQGLFYDSLVSGGFLCLGAKESIQLTSYGGAYNDIDKKHRIFRKKYIR